MVYISSSGDLERSRTWSLSRVPSYFYEFIEFLSLFVQTLVQPQLTRRGTAYEAQRRAPGRPPQDTAPRNRRVGGFRSQSDCASPPASGG